MRQLLASMRKQMPAPDMPGPKPGSVPTPLMPPRDKPGPTKPLPMPGGGKPGKP